jgi:hypothetical protein
LRRYAVEKKSRCVEEGFIHFHTVEKKGRRGVLKECFIHFHIVEKKREYDRMVPSAGDEIDVARQQLRRVLASAGFSRNERLTRFLRFVVEEHLQGRDSDLKESVIAVEVFGRRTDHDPKQDSIVRTEAARLRARLADTI